MEIVSGLVQKADNNIVIMDLGKLEGVMPTKEQQKRKMTSAEKALIPIIIIAMMIPFFMTMAIFLVALFAR